MTGHDEMGQQEMDGIEVDGLDREGSNDIELEMIKLDTI